MRKRQVKEICESPDARNRNVSINLGAGGIALRKFVSLFVIKGATNDKRCSIRSGDILKELKKDDFLGICNIAGNLTPS